MDLSTITGLLIGSACVGLALLSGGPVESYLDPVALALVLGGAGAATLISMPTNRLFQLHRVVLKVFRNRSVSPSEQVECLVSCSGRARREGILALEGVLDELDDPILVRGLELAIDGAEPSVIRAVLETELASLAKRHEDGRGLFERLGKNALAFGMIGTIIGLTGALSPPNGFMAPGLATALLPLLYGAILANLVFRPLAEKLAAMSGEEVALRSMAIEGVLAIQAGENPRNVGSKLQTFLPPRSRTSQALAA